MDIETMVIGVGLVIIGIVLTWHKGLISQGKPLVLGHYLSFNDLHHMVNKTFNEKEHRERTIRNINSYSKMLITLGTIISIWGMMI